MGVVKDSIRMKFVIIIFALAPTFGAWNTVNWTGLPLQTYVCKLAVDVNNKTKQTKN